MLLWKKRFSVYLVEAECEHPCRLLRILVGWLVQEIGRLVNQARQQMIIHTMAWRWNVHGILVRVFSKNLHLIIEAVLSWWISFTHVLQIGQLQILIRARKVYRSTTSVENHMLIPSRQKRNMKS